MLLLGDYAVVEGGRALVAAVDRRAEGVAEVGPDSAVVDAVFARARAEGPVAAPGARIDTSGFHLPGGDKLGIGSSAAAAVVAAALATERGDELCLSVALEGHRDAAGGVGSGIDVATSFYGGVVALGYQPGPVEPLPSRLRGLHLSVFYAGQSARTSELVTAAKACPRWKDWVAVMSPLAEEGIDAWRAGRASAFVSVVARYGRAMKKLGEDAGVGIVTETIDQLMAGAEALGGAAKPSGAGGGDIVIAVSEDPSLGPKLAERTGAVLVDLSIDRTGLKRS